MQASPAKDPLSILPRPSPALNEAIGDSRDPLPAAESGQRLRGIHILLVEDNPLNVLVAQTMLENNGATVDVAVNGAEALEKLDPGPTS